MNKQMVAKTTTKWAKPTIKTVTFQELSFVVCASACSNRTHTCLKNMR